MTRSTREILWEAFLKTQGPLLGCVGLIVGVAAWLIPIPSDVKVALNRVLAWAIPTAIAGVVAFITLVTAFLQSRALSRLPRVINGRHHGSASESVMLLLDESELFGHGSLVSVYHVDASSFEELLGVGYVHNIQENRMIQVVFTAKAGLSVCAKLASNDAAVLKNVRVKPTVPAEYRQ